MEGLSRGLVMLCIAVLGMAAGTAADAQRPLPPTPPAPPPLAVAAPLLQVKGAEMPVQLQRAMLDGTVAAGLAEIRIELEFHNPNGRMLEGQLEFPLADGQQVAGFALDIDGVLRDAVPVPKAQGRQVFEAIERRRVDPGLLEQTAGNQFRLRIYPIPAHGSRRVALTIRQTLPVDTQGLRWTLPLQFARGAQQASVQLQASGIGAPRASNGLPWAFALRDGRYQLQWQGRGAELPAQAQWSLPQVRQRDVVAGLHEGQRYLMAQIPVPVQAVARAMPTRIGLLWDASGSAGQRDREAEFAVLDRYFKAIGDGQVELTVLRDQPEATRRFGIRGGDWSALRAHLQALPLDGASALGAWTPQPAVQEYLLVSDGLSNYGNRSQPALAAGQRLYALSGAGARTDVARLRAWTAAHQGELLVLSTSADAASAAVRLLQQGAVVLSLEGEGISGLVADAGAAVQGWLRVMGRIEKPGGSVQLRVRLPDGRIDTQRVGAGEARLLPGGLVAHAWANGQLADWAGDPLAHAAARRTLSQAFGLVGADTSLLVLESIEDYLQHGIRPPSPLRAEYDRRHALASVDVARERSERLDDIARQFADRQRWWETRWPKGTPPQAKQEKSSPAAVAMAAPSAAVEAFEARPDASVTAPAPPAPPAPQAMRARPAPRAERDAIDETASRAANRGDITIALAPWAPDAPYAMRLRAASADALYPLYLSERAQHADSSAFYLDVADLLLSKGQRALALRVLSNLAEMQIENRHVLRVLGYRLMQAGAPTLAVPVFRDVLAMGEEEPQSFRDLGLALEASGQYPQALAALYEVVLRPWDSRFNGISLIALDEATNLMAREGLDARAIDPRLRRALPLDLRVVLGWDSDNSDMDLWVTDPNGERAYYGNRLTYQGGQMSQDFTGGYGPEQFSLRDAKPGTYRVEANFFGSREQLVTGATTLSLRLSTHWGTRQQRDQTVTLRLKDQAESVLVGEFTVK
ncbi:VIT domain-containing protein [Stenotrophomonas pennii]|uniref:VIT domain-containing protein n=1 Tax=Stenotrophomonas lacuserhaii TaxID=2760084 RepID=UPI00320A4304